MITTDWSTRYDTLILNAFLEGRVQGLLQGVPDSYIESGLAHIFFYGDTVYKLYKTEDDKDHFIKGVLAPTKRRTAFVEHDFAVNQHFSGGVYKQLHSVYYIGDFVSVEEYDSQSIYTLVEMSRLDFSHNLHEQLLRGEVASADMHTLGYEIARSIDSSPLPAPESVHWYDLASARVTLLAQFVDWLPEQYRQVLQDEQVIALLREHLEQNRVEYTAITGSQLSINVDNHDENVFIADGVVLFIDLLPPMDSWWYGLPYANLANVMVNVEVMHSKAAAIDIQNGYFAYHDITSLPEHSFGFVRAFAHLISIAHFGSVPGKEAVTEKYLAQVPEIKSWLQ